jgi:hypothetical protein
VPGKEFLIWTPNLVPWNCYARVVEAVVTPPVFELIPESVSDSKDEVRSNRNVATIIEPVKIPAKQEAVVHSMLAPTAIGLDVGCLEDRQGVFVSYGTCAIVRVTHCKCEQALSKPRPNANQLAISGRSVSNYLRCVLNIPVALADLSPGEAILEYAESLPGVELIRLTLLYTGWGPICRGRDKLIPGEKDWRRNHDASYLELA